MLDLRKDVDQALVIALIIFFVLTVVVVVDNSPGQAVAANSTSPNATASENASLGILGGITSFFSTPISYQFIALGILVVIIVWLLIRRSRPVRKNRED